MAPTTVIFLAVVGLVFLIGMGVTLYCAGKDDEPRYIGNYIGAAALIVFAGGIVFVFGHDQGAYEMRGAVQELAAIKKQQIEANRARLKIPQERP